ncbi:MAG: carboxymuconolactone decarboxylase family protein [Burkholderiaceae bacterium]
MPLLPSLPADALVKDVYPINPKLFLPWCQVEEMIMRGESELSAGEREMLGAYSSALNACTYCYSSHSEAAKLLGIEETVFTHMLSDPDRAPVNEKLKPILSFVKKLTLNPAKMTIDDARAVMQAGWQEKTLHDVIMVCCCYAFMNRLADGHGLPSDPSLFEERGRRHAEHGYFNQYASEIGADNKI